MPEGIAIWHDEEIGGVEIMKKLLCAFLLGLLPLVSATSALAQNYEHLLQDFRASELTREDKRFLQAALAFEGHYLGLLDGDWGRLSREAMARYSRKEFNSVSEEWHIAALALGFFDRFERDGWDMQFYPGLEMSVLVPLRTLVTDPRSANFINLRHSGSSLSISMGIHSQATAQRIHDFTMGAHARSSAPYSVRKSSLAISSVTKSDGSLLYARSNFINGAWSTIMLSARSYDASILSAVASSLTKGRASQLSITPNGNLEKAIRDTLEVVETETRKQQDEASQNVSRADQGAETNGSAGSGFVVSQEGHILTNAHVIEGCNEILVDGGPARLIDSSQEFDLAILKADTPVGEAVATFSAFPAKLNSDVTVVGYPYGGLLGGLNVTRGSVSSLKGLGGDATTMQVTAPVQSGNSGGPLLGPSGNVVGVVVSKLDAIKVAGSLGDMPQNVNFAIRGEIAKLFLAQNGVDPELSLSRDVAAPVAIAEQATKFTTFIECE